MAISIGVRVKLKNFFGSNPKAGVGEVRFIKYSLSDPKVPFGIKVAWDSGTTTWVRVREVDRTKEGNNVNGKREILIG
jgi:hypothetical protein